MIIRPTKSIYAMTRGEITKGIANRFVHSRSYIFLYLGMAALSVTTVALSLSDGCPGPSFYILEIIINTSMILEVAIRFVAFGRVSARWRYSFQVSRTDRELQQFWKSPFNVFDLIVTVFCALTLLVLAFAGCGATSKEEEMLDTLLLIARNVLQFGRLASVMRQYVISWPHFWAIVKLLYSLVDIRSGQSIFTRPRPIDLTAARRAGYNNLDLDLEAESDDEEDPQPSRPLARDHVLFDAQETQRPPTEDMPFRDMPRVAHPTHPPEEEEDVWADI